MMKMQRGIRPINPTKLTIDPVEGEYLLYVIWKNNKNSVHWTPEEKEDPLETIRQKEGKI